MNYILIGLCLAIAGVLLSFRYTGLRVFTLPILAPIIFLTVVNLVDLSFGIKILTSFYTLAALCIWEFIAVNIVTRNKIIRLISPIIFGYVALCAMYNQFNPPAYEIKMDIVENDGAVKDVTITRVYRDGRTEFSNLNYSNLNHLQRHVYSMSNGEYIDAYSLFSTLEKLKMSEDLRLLAGHGTLFFFRNTVGDGFKGACGRFFAGKTGGGFLRLDVNNILDGLHEGGTQIYNDSGNVDYKKFEILLGSRNSDKAFSKEQFMATFYSEGDKAKKGSDISGIGAEALFDVAKENGLLTNGKLPIEYFYKFYEGELFYILLNKSI